jgi:hypothetical protein
MKWSFDATIPTFDSSGAGFSFDALFMSFGLQNQRIHKTPIGYIDSAHLDGNDGSNIVPVWNAGLFQSSLTLIAGTPFSVDLSASASPPGPFVDPGSPASSLGFYTVSGQSAVEAGWILTGTILSNSAALTGSGAFKIVAVRNGISVLSQTLSFSINAATTGIDNIAPTIPTGIGVSPGSIVGTIDLSFDAPCDSGPGTTPASGAVHVDVLSNTSVVSPPSPIIVPANSLAAPTNVNIGTIATPQAPASSQTGTAWALSAAGTGIAATASEQCLLVDFGTFSGARKFIARLDAYTAGSATASLSGIILHETAIAGGKFLAIGLGPSDGTAGLYIERRTVVGAISSQIATQLKDRNGAVIAGPVYVKIERAADLQTLTISYSLNQLGWIVITSTTNAMAAAIHYGAFATSQNAGTAILATVEEIAVSNTPIVSTVITSAVQLALQLRSVDAAGNISTLSSVIQGIPSTSPVLPSKKWNPGHYCEFFTGASLNTGIAGRLSIYTAEASSQCKGYVLRIPWAAIETSFGVYDTSWFIQDLTRLESVGKSLGIIILTAEYFNDNTPNGMIPPYIWNTSDPHYSSAYNPGFYTGSPLGICRAAEYVSAVTDRLIALLAGLAALGLDSRPGLEFINICDETTPSALGTLSGGPPAGYSNAAWNAQKLRLVQQAGPLFAQTSVTIPFNFLPGYSNSELLTFGQAMLTAKCAFGGPDTLINSPTTGVSVWQGLLAGGANYQGALPMMLQVQSPDIYGGGFNGGTATPAQLFAYSNGTVHTTHLPWIRQQTSNPADWASSVLPFINANPLTHTARPSAY